VSNKDEVFLATTALEEFWDTSKPLLFMGEWCNRFSRRAFWETLEYSFLPNPWSSLDKINAGNQYLNKVYEDILEIVGSKLNIIHGVDRSKRYWRIVLGVWLFHYAANVYDKFLRLKSITEIYPQYTTILLSEKDYIIPSDTEDFVVRIINDTYNLQIISRMLKLEGKILPERGIASPEKRQIPQVNNSLSKSIKMLWYKLLDGKANNGMYMQSSYFSKSDEFRLKVRFKSKLALGFDEQLPMDELVTNLTMRAELSDMKIDTEDEFVRILVKLIPQDIPFCFLEGYQTLYLASKKKFRKYSNVKAIFSGTSWYFDETFKIWAADAREKGVALLGGQHGGMYGINANLHQEDYELSIVDKYFTWGWDREGFNNKIIPMAALKLNDIKDLQADNQLKDILFVSNIWPRYFLRFTPILPHEVSTYIEWQIRFAAGLDKNIRDALHIRGYINDFGWEYADRWSDAKLEVIMDSWEIPFRKRLEQCRLVICDNTATTFLEVLASNKPTILFWDFETHYIRPEAMPFFDELIRVGILYKTPESAAHTVNQIYFDIESWWNNPELQKVRSRFCERFARVGPLREWIYEFSKVIAG